MKLENRGYRLNQRIDIELPGVLRWIRRRIKLVRATLAMLIELIKPYPYNETYFNLLLTLTA
jgi:hypothetical protein